MFEERERGRNRIHGCLASRTKASDAELEHLQFSASIGFDKQKLISRQLHRHSANAAALSWSM